MSILAIKHFSLTSKDLVSKKDLSELKLDLIKLVLGVGISGVIVLSGVMLTLLKLMLH